jgi:NAD(P)H-nitrite reductase large subunit
VIPGTEFTVAADVLTVGHGFTPNLELPVQAGCALAYKKSRGGWVVQVNSCLESSVESVYVPGEPTGIAGAQSACLQGQIAALAILEKMNQTKRNFFSARREKLIVQDRHHAAYAAFFNRLCQVPGEAYAAIPDDTVICRCEDITMGTIRNRIAQGFDTMSSLKKASRGGMGRCQGRICGPVIFDIIMALTPASPDKIGYTLARAPVKTVPVRVFFPETTPEKEKQ